MMRSVTTNPTNSTTRAAKAPAIEVPAAIRLPAESLIVRSRPANATRPATIRGSPIENSAKNPSSRSPPLHAPRSAARHRGATVVDTAATIAISARYAATNGTRHGRSLGRPPWTNSTYQM